MPSPEFRERGHERSYAAVTDHLSMRHRVSCKCKCKPNAGDDNEGQTGVPMWAGRATTPAPREVLAGGEKCQWGRNESQWASSPRRSNPRGSHCSSPASRLSSDDDPRIIAYPPPRSVTPLVTRALGASAFEILAAGENIIARVAPLKCTTSPWGEVRQPCVPYPPRFTEMSGKLLSTQAPRVPLYPVALFESIHEIPRSFHERGMRMVFESKVL